MSVGLESELKLMYIMILRNRWKPIGYKEDETGGFVVLKSCLDIQRVRYYLYRN